MSHVTNIIVKTLGSERKAIKFINAWLAGRHSLKSFGVFNGLTLIDTDAAGGTKYLEMSLYAAAFNNLDVPRFIECVCQAPWEDEDSAQVFVQEQGEARLTDVLR